MYIHFITKGIIYVYNDINIYLYLVKKMSKMFFMCRKKRIS